MVSETQAVFRLVALTAIEPLAFQEKTHMVLKIYNAYMTDAVVFGKSNV